MDREILRSEAQKALEESGILARALEAAGRMAGAYAAFRDEWGKFKRNGSYGKKEELFFLGFLSDPEALKKEVEGQFQCEMERDLYDAACELAKEAKLPEAKAKFLESLKMLGSANA